MKIYTNKTEMRTVVEKLDVAELIQRIKEKDQKTYDNRTKSYALKKQLFAEPCPCDHINWTRTHDTVPLKCSYYDTCRDTGAACNRFHYWVNTGVHKKTLTLLDDVRKTK